MYTKQDYGDAIAFALNYPEEITSISYDKHIDKWIVHCGNKDNNHMANDYGWIRLEGSYIRSCLKWEGVPLWDR